MVFFGSLSFLEAFAYAVEDSGLLKGVVVGYVQKDGGDLNSSFPEEPLFLADLCLRMTFPMVN